MSKIKVLLVEDSELAIGIYEKMLNSSRHIEVVGKATNGIEGLNLTFELEPDVICTDLQMPEMDGIEFTKLVMAHHPTPILVLSNKVKKNNIDIIFAAMKAGALDVMAKPQISANYESMLKELITKIRILARKKVSPIPLN